MTDLSFADRAFVTYAKLVEKNVLRIVSSQKLLRLIFSLTAPTFATAPKGTRIETLPDGSRMIYPPGINDDAPILLYFHGGGFTIGSPRTHTGLVAHLAQSAGCCALVHRYCLAPEHPFPAAKDSCIAAFETLVAQGTPPSAICGDSAGGCLSLQVAQHARDTGQPMPKALGLIAPIADVSGDLAQRFADAPDEYLIPPAWPRRILRAYLPGSDRADPAVSPLLGDLTGLPATLIQAGEGEVLADDAKRLKQAMDDVTLDLWPGLQHVWHLHTGWAPAADRALKQMGQFLAKQIAEKR